MNKYINLIFKNQETASYQFLDDEIGNLMYDILLDRQNKNKNIVTHQHGNFDSTVSNYWVLQVDQSDNSKKVIINKELRKYFKHRFYGNYSSSLKVGYATNGQNLLHCVINNDLECVHKNDVAPQLAITSETVWTYNEENLKFTEKQYDDMWTKHVYDIMNWVVDNNLSRKIGYEDPIHLYSIQPTYAVPTKECVNWTKDKWFDLFNNVGLYKIEIV